MTNTVDEVTVETMPITVEFVTERPRLWASLDENGRRLWLSIEEHAHNSTGRSRATGQCTLAVAVRLRRNGLVRFDADLWKLPWNLSPGAISQLRNYWGLLNKETPKRMQSRMVQHFSRTFFQFDVMTEQVCEWRSFLTSLLTDAASYVSISSTAHSGVTL